MNGKNHRKIRWITRTGVLVALLIALQWGTSATQAYAGQYITGACVNCVLAVAALFGGLYSGITVALLSPFFAYLLGIGPKLIQIVPCIAIGNAVFTVCLHFLIGNKKAIWKQVLGLVASAVAKFGALYTGVVLVVIPLMADTLLPKQVQTFTAMFSWPQLVTAFTGGTIALLILPVIRKAIK